MVIEASFPTEGPPLTVESARAAVFVWLQARNHKARFTLIGDGDERKQELVWLGLDWDGRAKQGRLPEWAANLPPVEPAPPSPYGEWSGKTTLAELRELGVLPEALVNFLAVQGWNLREKEEVFDREELPAHWPPGPDAPRSRPFDFKQLSRINGEWIQRAEPERLLELALPYYERAGWLPVEDGELPGDVYRWMLGVVRAVQPGMDFLSLFPPRTRLVFDYKPEHYLKVPVSREAMERDGARDVLRAFARRALEESWLTPERFNGIVDEVIEETGRKGRELWQPIRVALTGMPFGPKVEDLILIFERGHELDLPVEVKSCRQRVLEFCSIFV